MGFVTSTHGGFAPIVDGHFDINSKTRADFDDFIGVVFDTDNSIACEDKVAAESQKQLHHLPATSSPASYTHHSEWYIPW